MTGGRATAGQAVGSRRVLLLDPQTGPLSREERWLTLDDLEIVDMYELGEVDDDPFTALVIAGMVDQEMLYERRAVIEAFLDRGKVVVFCGQLFRPWLPGCSPFVPAAISNFRDYEIRFAAAHPVFDGVDPVELTFRRGVAGFFARGHHPPPPGATILARLAGRQPITWTDHQTTPGTVFVHSGADLLGYAGSANTASRIVPQLLDWACSQGGRS